MDLKIIFVAIVCMAISVQQASCTIENGVVTGIQRNGKQASVCNGIFISYSHILMTAYCSLAVDMLIFRGGNSIANFIAPMT
jgi:hypothetical protein